MSAILEFGHKDIKTWKVETIQTFEQSDKKGKIKKGPKEIEDKNTYIKKW